jgi:hypothetical protein
MTTGEILRAAAARVRQGWTQGDYYDPSTDSVCAVGALCAVRGCDMTDSMEINLAVGAVHCSRAHHLLMKVTNTVNRFVHIWNDMEGQTAENVAAAFERAAVLADQEDALELTPPVSWTHRDPEAAIGAERCELSEAVVP